MFCQLGIGRNRRVGTSLATAIEFRIIRPRVSEASDSFEVRGFGRGHDCRRFIVHSARHRACSLAVRDILGDALWAMMVAWWMGALAPDMRLGGRAGSRLAFCCAVEFSQLYHAPVLDAVRRTTPGQLVFGSGFDMRDLVAYAMGVLTALMLEWAVRRSYARGD